MSGRRWAEAGFEEVQGFAGGMDGAFELGVFGGFEHGFELRAGFVTGIDQILAGDEKLWANVLRLG